MKLYSRLRRGISLTTKGVASLRQFGFRTTYQRARSTIRNSISSKRLTKGVLFTNHELSEQRFKRFPHMVMYSVVVPLYNTPEQFLREMIQSVINQTYPYWMLCMADGSDEDHSYVGQVVAEYAGKDDRILYYKLPSNRGISGNTNACLDMATGDYIALFDHDDLFHPAALYEVTRAICDTGADFVYTDESSFRLSPKDAFNHHFKPDFAPDNLCANNYICHFTAFERSLLDEVGGFEPECDGSQDHDMFLRLTEKAKRVAHIPEVLYYWRAHPGSAAADSGVKPYTIDAGVRAVERRLERLGLEGSVEPVAAGLTIYRVKYAIKGSPLVSILIPNSNHVEMLRNCIDSILAKTSWQNYEIVILENNSTSEELFEYYEKIQRDHDNVRVIEWPSQFNYSAINNFGVRNCDGDYLLLLNNDTEVISPDWIQELLMFAQRDDVGAAGAKLYYADGTIQHAGVGIGLLKLAGHFFRNVDRASLGYMGRLIYAQNVSAVTGACMMVRRSVWEQVGGLDESFPVDFNDIDFCLRIRKAGYLIVWTPYAELYHLESKTRKSGSDYSHSQEFLATVWRFQHRWRDELAHGDPYFNPNFSLDYEDFRIKSYSARHDAR